MKIQKTSVLKPFARFASKIGEAFSKGNLKTKTSFIVMGFGCFTNHQLVKGLIYFMIQIVYTLFMAQFGQYYLSRLDTLGDAVKNQIWDEKQQIFRYVQGDNSMLILLYGVLIIFISFAFVFFYFLNIFSAYQNQKLIASGKRPSSIVRDIKSLVNENYHKTLLTLPTLGIIAFTILPLVFMILIAFTNFDRFHQPPGNLFTWVGLKNMKDLFGQDATKSFTLRSLFVWTLTWAFFATFLNYILGMLLAIVINKKSILLKKLWRTIFVITIAVPQFVSLMLMSRLLHELGPLNVILQNSGLTNTAIPFLTNGTLAKIVVIVVNLWVGIPYTMLITTGVLMNIPVELYESARIDGATPLKIFVKITMPYMLFVSGPYLITQFIGNINNFNVIYLLTAGGPLSLDYFQAGKTDLLVTWLYKLTVNEQNYSLASTVGIIVFILSAGFSLIAFNTSSAVRKEEEFQ